MSYMVNSLQETAVGNKFDVILPITMDMKGRNDVLAHNQSSPTSPVGTLDSLPTEAFLKVVGLRVRRRRNALGMSRRRLAEVSSVSERYLAQLESGQGNMSIALLRKVTLALGISLGSLMDSEHDQPLLEALSQ
jgi:ribosome-binding protein aMBF1 (putative translation factor)